MGRGLKVERSEDGTLRDVGGLATARKRDERLLALANLIADIKGGINNKRDEKEESMNSSGSAAPRSYTGGMARRLRRATRQTGSSQRWRDWVIEQLANLGASLASRPSLSRLRPVSWLWRTSLEPCKRKRRGRTTGRRLRRARARARKPKMKARLKARIRSPMGRGRL